MDDAIASLAPQFFVDYAANEWDHPFSRGIAEWRRRIDSCADSECRRNLLEDLLRRLRFAGGQPVGPFANIPSRNGIFRIDGSQVVGGMQVLPLHGDEIVVSVVTSESDASRWICTVVAHGRLAGGEARMKSDDPREEFILRWEDAEEVEVRQGPSGDGGCSIRGWIVGSYKLATDLP